MLKPIPLFGIGTQGRSAALSVQSRTNLYIEFPQDSENGTMALYPTVGLELFTNFGETPIRGCHVYKDKCFIVHRNRVHVLQNDSLHSTYATTLGTNDGRVSIADNGIQICIVDGEKTYIIDPIAETIDIVDMAATHVIFLDSFFVACLAGDTGQFQVSNSYNGLVWDALDYATAEGSPDALVSIISDGGTLQLFGETTLEPWGNTGALDFPFFRIGSNTIEWGLAAEWSLVKYLDSLMFLRKNRLGQVQVCQQAGGQSVAVSTPEIDYEISTYTVVSDATAYGYMLFGHPFYQINFPSENKSWLYDGATKAWTKLEYGVNGDRHRGEMLFTLVNNQYVTDYENGKVYRISSEVYTDDGETIVREVVSRHQSTGELKGLSQLWLEVEPGVALQTGQGSDPQIMLRISRDGGNEWGAENWRSIGKVGKYKHRAVWNRLGRARDWVFKFRFTDPVKLVITQAWAQHGG